MNSIMYRQQPSAYPINEQTLNGRTEPLQLFLQVVFPYLISIFIERFNYIVWIFLWNLKKFSRTHLPYNLDVYDSSHYMRGCANQFLNSAE